MKSNCLLMQKLGTGPQGRLDNVGMGQPNPRPRASEGRDQFHACPSKNIFHPESFAQHCRSDGRGVADSSHGSAILLMLPFFLFKERNQASSSGGLSDQEKREKKALEKKLLEMEEELRVRHLYYGL